MQFPARNSSPLRQACARVRPQPVPWLKRPAGRLQAWLTRPHLKKKARASTLFCGVFRIVILSPQEWLVTPATGSGKKPGTFWLPAEKPLPPSLRPACPSRLVISQRVARCPAVAGLGRPALTTNLTQRERGPVRTRPGRRGRTMARTRPEPLPRPAGEGRGEGPTARAASQRLRLFLKGLDQLAAWTAGSARRPCRRPDS